MSPYLKCGKNSRKGCTREKLCCELASLRDEQSRDNQPTKDKGFFYVPHHSHEKHFQPINTHLRKAIDDYTITLIKKKKQHYLTFEN